jgi:predicted metalloprotease with PDZ domain
MVRVTQVFPPAPEARTFRMAAWVPGSYKIRDFGRHVQDVTATVAGATRKVEQVGKDAWHVAGSTDKEVTLSFSVYARELTVDTSHVTNDHAHLFPATLALYDEHSRPLPHEVELVTPPDWMFWSGLESAKLDGLNAAEDYDHLIDCPIEIGPAEDYHVLTFSARRKKHRIILWKAPESMDAIRLTNDIKAIVEATAKLFGGLPYDHYTFIGHVAMEHGGGLEHRNSTVLGIDPLHLLMDEKIKRNFLPLVAHEFFHTWNVKRIVPEKFQPYNLQTEVYTELLWLFEGFTTYYELPLLKRAGVADDAAFGKLAAELLQYYEMALGRHHRSVGDCSRLTWTLLYQTHEHNINRNVSYYTKGLFVGLCLDAHLRQHGVAEGLDVVMRELWKRHAKVGLPENGFASLVHEATGVDCTRLLNSWTRGTSEMPIERSFRTLGFDVKREYKDPKKSVGLGVMFKPSSYIIERIPEDSPCYDVLQPDDEMVAMDGYKWKGARFGELANTRKAGETVELAVFREGRMRHFDVPLREMVKDKITITPRKGDAAATRRRRAWLEET